jgi:hypothetical protein
MIANEADRYKSIEWSILEDAVEGSRPSLRSVTQLIGHDNPGLDVTSRLRVARELVQRMIDADLISIIRPTTERPREPTESLSLEAAWDARSDAELKKYIIAATPRGEAAYLAY